MKSWRKKLPGLAKPGHVTAFTAVVVVTRCVCRAVAVYSVYLRIVELFQCPGPVFSLLPVFSCVFVRGYIIELYILRNRKQFIRPHETVVPGGLCFTDVFFRHEISELRRPIAAKLCLVIRTFFRLITKAPKFWGPSLKKVGAKNVQNLGRLRTTKFDREYLRNGRRYPKSERPIESDSSRVRQKVRWTLVH